MRIISRYIAKDIFTAILSVAFVLLLIILGRLFIQLLSEVLDGDLTVNTLGTVLLLGVIRYLVILLPFSFFLATIMVLSRMYKESEINALNASGADPFVLLRAVFMVGMPLVIVVYFLVAQISPWASRLAEVIENVTEQRMALTQLTPGKFFELEHTGWVVYAEAKDTQENHLQNVFVQRKEGNKVIVELAKSAQISDADNSDSVFVLKDGRRIEGVPGEANYTLSSYKEHQVFPPRADFSREANKPEYQPLLALLDSSDPEYKAELQQRLSIVFSTFVLMLLAVPLSKIRPESGRFARFALAVAIYIVYLNLVIVCCSVIKRGEMLGMVMLYSVHISALLIAIITFQRKLLPRY